MLMVVIFRVGQFGFDGKGHYHGIYLFQNSYFEVDGENIYVKNIEERVSFKNIANIFYKLIES